MTLHASSGLTKTKVTDQQTDITVTGAMQLSPVLITFLFTFLSQSTVIIPDLQLPQYVTLKNGQQTN